MAISLKIYSDAKLYGLIIFDTEYGRCIYMRIHIHMQTEPNVENKL